MEVWESAVRELCSMPVLLWLAITDKRSMKIKRTALAVAAGLLLFAGSFGRVGIESRLGGAAFGVIMLLFCHFSQEALGMAGGIAFGLQETVALCFFGAWYAGMYSAVLLVTHRAGRKSRIPFLPFLLLGYVTMALLSHGV